VPWGIVVQVELGVLVLCHRVDCRSWSDQNCGRIRLVAKFVELATSARNLIVNIAVRGVSVFQPIFGIGRR